MKKIILTLLLLLALPMQAMAAENVQSMVDALPEVSVLQEMDMDQQRQVYDQTQAAYDAYMALSEEEKAAIPGAEDTIEELFGYFNTLVAPAQEIAQEPVQEDSGAAGIVSTAIAALIGLFLAKKLVTKKRM